MSDVSEDQEEQVSDLIQQLEDVEQRLIESASGPAPDGLTEPDQDTDERWEAAQVWAHMAEFVGYWHAQIETVVRLYDGAPVPFGRVKSDAGRIHAIEIGRHRPTADLASQVEAAIESLATYLASLDANAWQARGLHQTRGVMDVPAMVKRFISDHLDEHARQLEELVESE